MANPQFQVTTASAATEGGTEDSGTSVVTPTGDPGTSTTRPGTGGTGGTGGTETSDVETTQTVTSVAETTQTATSTDGTTTQSDTGGPYCGDGVINVDGEECDDGNAIDDDGCTKMCIQTFCGDGDVQAEFEECDDGPDNSDTGNCTSACKNAVCGDGKVHAGEEQCDDGNQIEDDACTNMCTTPVCGDGVIQVQQGEQCDAGALKGTKLANCFEDCSVALDPNFPLKILLLGEPIMGLIGGIAGGDAKCKNKFGSNYRMLAADGGTRVATQSPNLGDGLQTGWVLQKYRIYVNANNDLVFITGSERLLGVRNQKPVSLVNPIHGEPVRVWTGLDKEWVATKNCVGWTLGTNASLGGYGVANENQNGSFIGVDTQGCNSPATTIYCVQVPPG